MESDIGKYVSAPVFRSSSTVIPVAVCATQR